MRKLIVIVAVAALAGCSSGPGDLSQERSPSAPGTQVKSTGPAQLKASMDKMQHVGQGDGLVRVKG